MRPLRDTLAGLRDRIWGPPLRTYDQSREELGGVPWRMIDQTSRWFLPPPVPALRGESHPIALTTDAIRLLKPTLLSQLKGTWIVGASVVLAVVLLTVGLVGRAPAAKHAVAAASPAAVPGVAAASPAAVPGVAAASPAAVPIPASGAPVNALSGAPARELSTKPVLLQPVRVTPAGPLARKGTRAPTVRELLAGNARGDHQGKARPAPPRKKRRHK